MFAGCQCDNAAVIRSTQTTSTMAHWEYLFANNGKIAFPSSCLTWEAGQADHIQLTGLTFTETMNRLTANGGHIVNNKTIEEIQFAFRLLLGQPHSRTYPSPLEYTKELCATDTKNFSQEKYQKQCF
jgi:hypothetical protein